MLVRLYRIYQKAIYRVDGPCGSIRLGIRDSWKTLCLWSLAKPPNRSAQTAAIITAHNPCSRRRSAFHNKVANRRLLAKLQKRRLRYFPAAGIDPVGIWPEEPGYFVLGCNLDEARALAADAGQAAFVWIRRGSGARLALTQHIKSG
jgi:hypothetical protein